MRTSPLRPRSCAAIGKSDLSALTGRTWDAVVDPSGYVPGVVRASAEKLAESVGFYVFVSSLSAYADRSKAMVEGDALEELGDMPDDRLLEDFSNYGALKALAETGRRRRDVPQTHANVRPGLIVGPHDPTGRFTYWPHRVLVAKPGDEVNQSLTGLLLRLEAARAKARPWS